MCELLNCTVGKPDIAGPQVNLVATQLVLDREHPNRLVFSPSRGLDPLLDLRLRGAQVRGLPPACSVPVSAAPLPKQLSARRTCRRHMMAPP